MRELLERAALNAGYEIFGWDAKGNPCIDPVIYTPWNPADSDADAFRLMVDCEMEIDFGDKSVVIRQSNGLKFIALYANYNNDKHAATRMAILKAAAGRSYKPIVVISASDITKAGWIHAGKFHRSCRFCGRIISEPIKKVDD